MYRKSKATVSRNLEPQKLCVTTDCRQWKCREYCFTCWYFDRCVHLEVIIGTNQVKAWGDNHWNNYCENPKTYQVSVLPEIIELSLIFLCIFDIKLKAHRQKLTRYFAGTMKLLTCIGHKEKFVLLQPAMQIELTSSLQLLTLRLLMSYIYIWSTYSWCF